MYILFLLIILYILDLILFKETFEQDNRDWLEKLFDRREIVTIPSRIENVNNFCKSFNIKPTIFKAILKNDISYNNKFNLKIGEIACAMSQETVLRNFISSNDQTLLMFEDDVMPFTDLVYSRSNVTLADLQKYVKKAVKSLPVTWDILYLGRCWDDCENNIRINNYLVKTNYTLCHHAIAFSRDGAKKVLKHIKHPLNKPIDHIVAMLTKKRLLDSYATNIPIFYQNRDDLTTTIGNFDNLPICKKR